MPETIPLWVTIIIALLGAIAGFWPKIKSTYELKIKGDQALKIKKIDAEHEKVSRLEEKLIAQEEKLEKQGERILLLTEENTQLRMSLIFTLEEYQKSNPENERVLGEIDKLLSQKWNERKEA